MYVYSTMDETRIDGCTLHILENICKFAAAAAAAAASKISESICFKIKGLIDIIISSAAWGFMGGDGMILLEIFSVMGTMDCENVEIRWIIIGWLYYIESPCS